MADRSQGVDTVDDQHRRSLAFDLCAHLSEHETQVDDLGFARRVVYFGSSVSEYGSHQQVLGCTNAGEIEPNRRAGQLLGLGDDEPVFVLDGCTHLHQSTDVQVEWPRADGVATRECDVGFTSA